jgi:hypothetical protein
MVASGSIQAEEQLKCTMRFLRWSFGWTYYVVGRHQESFYNEGTGLRS